MILEIFKWLVHEDLCNFAVVWKPTMDVMRIYLLAIDQWTKSILEKLHKKVHSCLSLLFLFLKMSHEAHCKGILIFKHFS